MVIERAWAMPNSCTFSIPPIKKLLTEILSDKKKICDPFVKESPFKNRCISNDLDTSVSADFHLDALEFLRSRSVNEFDALLFDPPYSPRQVSECYKKQGMSVNMQTTQASFWSAIKSEISRVCCEGATVITCGWNSGGVGKSYGFTIKRILLVAHGGWHNDTIVTIETAGRKKTIMDAENTAHNRQ